MCKNENNLPRYTDIYEDMTKTPATKAPGVAIFLSTLYCFRIRLEFFPLRCYRLVANFARDAILTSIMVFLVRYWLVFLNQVRIFPVIFLCFSEKKIRLELLSSGAFVATPIHIIYI